jgi:hypothetical protein
MDENSRMQILLRRGINFLNVHRKRGLTASELV